MIFNYKEYFNKLREALRLIDEVRKDIDDANISRELYYLEHKLYDILVLVQDKLYKLDLE